jgi:hypothetical protein
MFMSFFWVTTFAQIIFQFSIKACCAIHGHYTYIDWCFNMCSNNGIAAERTIRDSNPGRGNEFISSPKLLYWLWDHTVLYQMCTGGFFLLK